MLEVKANWDAAIDGNEKKVGIGVILRDSAGDILASLCQSYHCAVQPCVAEAHALRRAMEFCEELGFSNVSFEGDSQSIIQAINSVDENWMCYGQLIEDIRRMQSWRPFWKVRI